MLINLSVQAGALNAGVRGKIRQRLLKIGSPAKSVEILMSSQKGVWNLFENMLAISWICPADDEAARMNIREDIEAIEQALLPLLRKHYIASEQDVAWHVHEGDIAGGEQARDSWRALFGVTLQQWKPD
jgi:hypothetical protein